MKPMLVRFATALALTLPIYVGIARLGPVEDWFMSGAGWRAFEPLFRLGGAIGVEGNGRILVGTMLLISFAIAFVVVSMSMTLFRKLGPAARSQ